MNEYDIIKMYSEKLNKDAWYIEVEGAVNYHGPFDSESIAKTFADNEL